MISQTYILLRFILRPDLILHHRRLLVPDKQRPVVLDKPHIDGLLNQRADLADAEQLEHRRAAVLDELRAAVAAAGDELEVLLLAVLVLTILLQQLPIQVLLILQKLLPNLPQRPVVIQQNIRPHVDMQVLLVLLRFRFRYVLVLFYPLNKVRMPEKVICT
jgi:hypothetical protein